MNSTQWHQWRQDLLFFFFWVKGDKIFNKYNIEFKWEKGKEVWSPDRSQTPISSTLNVGSLKRQLYTLSYDAIHTNIIHTAMEHFIQIGKVILFFFWHSSSPKLTALLYPYTRKIGIDLKSRFTQQKLHN